MCLKLIRLDPMSSRLNEAMNRLSVDSSRNSLSRPPGSAAVKRHSGLNSDTINAMFPDAAAAIATEKAKFTQQTGNPPSSNRNSTAYDSRPSLPTPSIAAPVTVGSDASSKAPLSPWASRNSDVGLGNRPKSSSGVAPMGQFMQPPPSAGIRSPRHAPPSDLQTTTILAPSHQLADLPMLSPYNAGSGNWASMMNTPMVPTFNQAAASTQADMIANATAMKLAALSTVNNRFALDDVRKYRRARSNDGHGNSNNGPMSPGFNPAGNAAVVMINEHGQILSKDQVIALQNQPTSAFGGSRSRPSSPGLAMHGSGFNHIGFSSPQNNGFLTAYDGPSPLLNSGMGGLTVNHYGMGGHEGYLSDHSDMVRGRSPRGRRGSSKPPEDPTDPSLLQDIPSWLRSLRLHKYTDNLKDMNWTELVELDDKALEERGVNALGARRKMLKVFEQVKGQSFHARDGCTH